MLLDIAAVGARQATDSHVAVVNQHGIAFAQEPLDHLDKGPLAEVVGLFLEGHAHEADGRELVLTRYTEPEREPKLFLEQLNLNYPPSHRRKSPPRRPKSLSRASAWEAAT